ncbi:MAG: 2'-5' RNA ligase family protein [Candidatus Micrarchaeaceae archaeon]|jgi:2'-5' RNA ligase
MTKCALLCLLKDDVDNYHNKLVNRISREFNLPMTKKQAIPTHFTLKYRFESKNLKQLEKLLEKFCKTHKKTSVKVGGFDSFPPKTIFIDVKPSREAKKVFFELLRELKKIKWMDWDKYDGRNLHFHSTIAEECNDKFKMVLKSLDGKEKHFDCWFDNITIMKMVKPKDNVDMWEVYKTFHMK